MLSAGILAFLFMDVGAEGLGIIETHLDAYKDGDATLWPVVGLFALLSVGFLAGVGRHRDGAAAPGRERAAAPPDRRRRVDHRDEPARRRPSSGRSRRPGRRYRTAMVIAVAIGLHNFAEGLAIGVSRRPARSGSRPS
jgi:ZIP family zinc transporter